MGGIEGGRSDVRKTVSVGIGVGSHSRVDLIHVHHLALTVLGSGSRPRRSVLLLLLGFHSYGHGELLEALLEGVDVVVGFKVGRRPVQRLRRGEVGGIRSGRRASGGEERSDEWKTVSYSDGRYAAVASLQPRPISPPRGASPSGEAF